MTKTPSGGVRGRAGPVFYSFLALCYRIGIIDLLAVMSMAVYL